MNENMIESETYQLPMQNKMIQSGCFTLRPMCLQSMDKRLVIYVLHRLFFTKEVKGPNWGKNFFEK